MFDVCIIEDLQNLELDAWFDFRMRRLSNVKIPKRVTILLRIAHVTGPRLINIKKTPNPLARRKPHPLHQNQAVVQQTSLYPPALTPTPPLLIVETPPNPPKRIRPEEPPLLNLKPKQVPSCGAKPSHARVAGRRRPSYSC